MAEQRLIDAEAFLKTEIDRCGSDPLVGTCTSDNEYLSDRLKKAPTIEAKPVVHAHWVYDKATEFWGNPYRCSNCHAARPRKTKFCPDCGSKMDEEV